MEIFASNGDNLRRRPRAPAISCLPGILKTDPAAAMTTKTFSVVPIDRVWAVEQAMGAPLMFLSGARAEAKTKQLVRQVRRRQAWPGRLPAPAV